MGSPGGCVYCRPLSLTSTTAAAAAATDDDTAASAAAAATAFYNTLHYDKYYDILHYQTV